jgi:hypothetical protein
MCEKILERRQNDKGRRLFLYIGSQHTPVRVSALPGAGLGEKDKAEVAAFRDANNKAKDDDERAKDEDDRDMDAEATVAPAKDWTSYLNQSSEPVIITE